jgi:hypothetical protein
MSKVNVFDSFVSVETKSRVFGEGTHEAALTTVTFSDSFSNVDGSAKEYDTPPEWTKPTPQVITFFKNGENAIMKRYQMLGYDKRQDLTDKQWESGKYTISEQGYVLLKGERVVNKEKTASCHKILSELFAAVGLPAGSDLNDLVEAAEDEPMVKITVKEDVTTNGNKSFEVTKVRKHTVTVDIADEAL